MERCHNSIYLTRFLSFLKIFFQYANEITILNVIFKINILADLVAFYTEFVYKDSRKKRGREVFVYFFKELCTIMEDSANRPDCKIFRRELNSSLNWVNFRRLAQDDVFDPSSILCDPAVFLGPDCGKIKSTYLSAPVKAHDTALFEAGRKPRKTIGKKSIMEKGKQNLG